MGAYGEEFDVAAAIDLAQEHAGVRFTAHGWDDPLVDLASERAWFAANRAAFENRAP